MAAGTFTQIHLQLIFAVKYRQALIDPSWEERLYQYIGGIIKQNGHKPLLINGMPDHLHIVLGFRQTQALAGLLQDVKQMSSRWINDNHLSRYRFAWQEGYGAFSYRRADLPTLLAYVRDQKEHHRQQSFSAEYRALLDEFEVEYDPRYLFAEPD